MAENQKLHLRIITPERMFYEGDVDMVEFNTTEGEIGVLPGHIPLTVIIKPGILVITADCQRRSQDNADKCCGAWSSLKASH